MTQHLWHHLPVRVISAKMGNQSRWTRIMEEHAGTSMSGDCWGTAHEDAGRSKFPIFQEQQIFPSSTPGPMESCRPDICTRQRISCIGIVSSCWRDAFFITSFIFQTLLFYELQSHALPLWGAVINYSKSGTRANLSSDQENVKLGS